MEVGSTVNGGSLGHERVSDLRTSKLVTEGIRVHYIILQIWGSVSQ